MHPDIAVPGADYKNKENSLILESKSGGTLENSPSFLHFSPSNPIDDVIMPRHFLTSLNVTVMLFVMISSLYAKPKTWKCQKVVTSLFANSYPFLSMFTIISWRLGRGSPFPSHRPEPAFILEIKTDVSSRRWCVSYTLKRTLKWKYWS